MWKSRRQFFPISFIQNEPSEFQIKLESSSSTFHLILIDSKVRRRSLRGLERELAEDKDRFFALLFILIKKGSSSSSSFYLLYDYSFDHRYSFKKWAIPGLFFICCHLFYKQLTQIKLEKFCRCGDLICGSLVSANSATTTAECDQVLVNYKLMTKIIPTSSVASTITVLQA